MTFEISKPQVAEKTEALNRGAGFNPYRLSSQCASIHGKKALANCTASEELASKITFKFQTHTAIAMLSMFLLLHTLKNYIWWSMRRHVRMKCFSSDESFKAIRVEPAHSTLRFALSRSSSSSTWQDRSKFSRFSSKHNCTPRKNYHKTSATNLLRFHLSPSFGFSPANKALSVSLSLSRLRPWFEISQLQQLKLWDVHTTTSSWIHERSIYL